MWGGKRILHYKCDDYGEVRGHYDDGDDDDDDDDDDGDGGDDDDDDDDDDGDDDGSDGDCDDDDEDVDVEEEEEDDDVEEESGFQDRKAYFARACAVEMHMDIWDEPLRVVICRKNAGRSAYHLDQTHRSVWPRCLGKNPVETAEVGDNQ